MIGLARQAHACTHTTIAPTVVHGGTKTNVIPDRVELELDIRTLPGQTADELQAMLREAIGPELIDDVEIVNIADDPATASPVDTPLWDVLTRAAQSLHPGTSTVPFMTVGATDSRFFRRLGVTAYGFGLFSERIGFEEFSTMFHGDDERVDVESLRLSTELWDVVARDMLAS
jgi:acetylornithine deacetylase/succinyl-diaminopimelate desuccinylase-like protein